MHLRSSLSAAIVLVASGTAIAFGAGTPEAPEPLRLVFVAPVGCPDANAFFTEVRARTARVRRANAGEDARLVRVTIEQSGGKSVGTIALGAGDDRTITGDTCAEVVSALAFVAAVAVDPAVAFGPPPTNVTSATSAGAEPAAGTASVSVAAPPSASVSTVMPAPPPSTSASTSSPPPPPIARVSAGFGIATFGARAPGYVLYTPVHAEVAWSSGIFSPALRLSFARGSGGVVASDVGNARFQWTVGQLDVCPLRLALATTIAARPCAGLEAGTLAARGEIQNPRSDTRAWVAARLALRLEWAILDALVLDGRLGLAAPLVRDQFVFDPDTTVYRTPPIQPFFGLSLSVRF